MGSGVWTLHDGVDQQITLSIIHPANNSLFQASLMISLSRDSQQLSRLLRIQGLFDFDVHGCDLVREESA